MIESHFVKDSKHFDINSSNYVSAASTVNNSMAISTESNRVSNNSSNRQSYESSREYDLDCDEVRGETVHSPKMRLDSVVQVIQDTHGNVLLK